MKITDSCECGKSELDLFTVPETQIVVESGRWDLVKPHPSFTDGTVIFDIEGDSTHYIDMSQTELGITLRLKKNNGNEITAANMLTVYPVNNLFHSIFSQVLVKIGGTEVENTNSNYAYRAYIDNLLCYGSEEKSTFLLNEFWIKDTFSAFETLPNKVKNLIGNEWDAYPDTQKTLLTAEYTALQG